MKATSLFCQPAINSLAGIQLDSVSSAVITRQKDKWWRWRARHWFQSVDEQIYNEIFIPLITKWYSERIEIRLTIGVVYQITVVIKDIFNDIVWETDFFILTSGTVVICTLWPVFNGQKILLISNNQIELLQSVWNIGFFQLLFWFGSQIISTWQKYWFSLH